MDLSINAHKLQWCYVLEAKVASRPKFWPRPQPWSFGLGLKVLASAWPRSCCLIM